MFLDRRSERGGIIFYIIIAIFLFAGLGLAVSTSMRSSGEAPNEKADVVASQVIAYGSALASGIQRMRMVNDIPDYGLDLYKGRYFDALVRTNSTCTNNKCVVFHPEGSGMSYQQFPYGKDFTGSVSYSAQVAFYSAHVRGVGDDTKPELILWVGLLEAPVCSAINAKLGVLAAGTTPPNDDRVGAPHYSGNLTSFPTSTKFFGDTNTAFRNQRAFCYWHSYWGGNYVHVILPR